VDLDVAMDIVRGTIEAKTALGTEKMRRSSSRDAHVELRTIALRAVDESELVAGDVRTRLT
jgi:hypothetical protein